MHYETQANILFYALSAVIGVVFLAGVLGMIHMWRLGKHPTLNTNIKRSRWMASFLSAVLIQKQILSYSILAWISHMMMFWGFMSLLMLTAFHFVMSWFVPRHTDVFQYFSSGNGTSLGRPYSAFHSARDLVSALPARMPPAVAIPPASNKPASAMNDTNDLIG